jgi:LruC domain-containing protein
MMAWAKTQENKTAKIFQKGDWDGHGLGQGKWDGWNVHVRTSDNVSHLLHWGGGLPVMNEWYHLAMTYDGATLKMYVNGQLRNSAPLTGSLKLTSRDIAIGSDNNAQKYFKGSIDEVMFFGTALSQTEIQANYNNLGEVSDQDGDGVTDEEDSYPNDPARAFNNHYPAEGFGSLAFEDLWPGKGDYDFNDLVVDYQFTIVSNSGNKVTEVLSAFAIRAIGAGFANGFGFQLPGNTLQSSDIQVEGSVLKENYITLNENGTEASQEEITVIVFDNVNKIMPPTSGFGVNVIQDDPYVEPDTVVVNIGFTPGVYGIDDLGLNNFNPFLIINLERGKEVHLPDYLPTSLVDQTYFGTGQDGTDPLTGKYYKTVENLPWAIKIASSYDYTIESAQITSAHLKFAAWAESSGTQFPDWYLDLSGYRNDANIYLVP